MVAPACSSSLLAVSVVQQFAGSGADCCADGGRGQQWWCEQSDCESDGAQAGCAFADHVVGLFD